MATGDYAAFGGRVVGVSSLEQKDGSVFRTAIVDLGRGNNVTFSYSSAKDLGIAFVKPDDMVLVKLEVLGASRYDAG